MCYLHALIMHINNKCWKRRIIKHLLFRCPNYTPFLAFCYLHALIIMLLSQQLILKLAFIFSTLSFMTRVRRFNARKDCLVCIVGVIAGGHYDQGRDLNAKLHDHYFMFNSLASKDILSLICLTAHQN